MKELIIKITFDDEGGYKGYGDDIPRLIKNIIEREINELEDDEVIKGNWEIEVI